MRAKPTQKGFTMVETMVALLVISIGLLGIAKMQALALASTSTARMRSIAALQAASMTAMMHANRGYWSSFQSPAPPAAALVVTVNVTPSNTTTPFSTRNTTITAPTGGVCTAAAPCTETQLAAVDLTNWATALRQTMPSNTTATITCDGSTALTPVACTVRLDWTENVVELNTGMNTALTAAQNSAALKQGAPTHFTVNVEP
jgi:type IV pilus assembly protein PilV